MFTFVLSLVLYVALATIQVTGQATNSGPCFEPNAACYTFGVIFNACGADYTCLCGSGTSACMCGALHQYGPQCITCINANSATSDQGYAEEINDSLSGCIGINGTNAVVQSSASSTSSTGINTQSSTSTSSATQNGAYAGTTSTSEYTYTTLTTITSGGIVSTATATVTTATAGNINSSPTASAHTSSIKLSGGVIGAIAAGAVVVLLILGALSFFCLRRKPAARYDTDTMGYNDKPFEGPPVEYQQQNPVYPQQNPVYQQPNPAYPQNPQYQQPNPVNGEPAGGRTYGIPEQTGGNWVNGGEVAGGRVGRAF